MTYSIVIASFPNLNSAEKISVALIKKKLVACANIIPGIKSKYGWKGKIENHSEAFAIFKIKTKSYKNVETLIKKLHPYEIPEILLIKITKGNKNYLNWISSVTR